MTPQWPSRVGIGSCWGFTDGRMDGLIDANLIVRRNAYLWFGTHWYRNTTTAQQSKATAATPTARRRTAAAATGNDRGCTYYLRFVRTVRIDHTRRDGRTYTYVYTMYYKTDACTLIGLVIAHFVTNEA